MNTITAIIRQRGQLTIPDSLRNRFPWLKPSTVVTITARGNDAIVITPHRTVSADEPDWRSLWRKIAVVRSFTGKRGNLSEFIAEDRNRH